MGKYLDIARQFEARRRAEQQNPPSAQRQEMPSPTCSQEDAFLEKQVPQPALEAFPDWEGLLVKSSVLAMNVWVVRTRQEGEGLAKETGHPALLLDDVLSQKGKTPAEARESLLPLLIVGTVQ